MIHAKSEALQDRMIRSGLTGAGLARATGITQGYVCLILNGKRAILPPTAKKICDVLGCGFDDIFIVKREVKTNATGNRASSTQ